MQWWFPIALGASVASGFGLWFALSDYERARYYPIILAVPAVLFAGLGLAGISANNPPTLGQIAQVVGNPLGSLNQAPRSQGIF